MINGEFERIIHKNFEYMRREGLKREALVVLARFMQVHLQKDLGQEIPCSGSLEVLMRAVTAVIEGDPRSGSYVAEKLKYASRTLCQELPKVMPGFAEAITIH